MSYPVEVPGIAVAQISVKESSEHLVFLLHMSEDEPSQKVLVHSEYHRKEKGLEIDLYAGFTLVFHEKHSHLDQKRSKMYAQISRVASEHVQRKGK